MRRLHKFWRNVLLACITGALLLGASGVLAQERSEEVDAGEADTSEAATTGGLWEKLDALRATLDPDAIDNADDEAAAEIAGAASRLLIGSAEEAGVIALVQELAGVSAEEIGDAHTVVLAGNDGPEVLALAHLLLAAETLTTSADQVALLIAGQHVEHANNLLAPFRPLE